MASLSDIIGNAKAATGSLGGSIQAAAGQLARGDVQGATQSLFEAPGTALDTFGASGGVMPGDAFAGLNARQDALQSVCWYCLPPTIKNSNALSLASTQPSITLPWYYVQTMNMPFRDIQLSSVPRNGRQAHYPESYSVTDLNLGLFMDSANSAMAWFKAWQGLVVGNKDPKQPNNQGQWGRPADYKKDIQVFLLDVTRRTMLQVRYINCTPSSATPLELTSGDSTALLLNVAIKVEDIDVTVSNNKGLIDQLIDTAGGYALSAISNIATPYLNQLGDIAPNLQLGS